jgi:hypothetical protein
VAPLLGQPQQLVTVPGFTLCPGLTSCSRRAFVNQAMSSLVISSVGAPFQTMGRATEITLVQIAYGVRSPCTALPAPGEGPASNASPRSVGA